LSERHYIFDERFAESFLHAPSHRVCGFKLKPFSCWHRLQLEWIDSKILLGGATLWDLYLAAKICSTEYPYSAQLREFGPIRSILWHIWSFRKDFVKEIHKFYAYIEDYNSPPKLWGGTGSAEKKLAEAFAELARATGSKEHAMLANQAAYRAFLAENQDNQIDDTLMQVAMYTKITGRPSADAWNMPSGELAWMNISFSKLDGGKVDVWTPMDEAEFQKHLIVRQEKIAEIAKELEEEHADDLRPELSMYYAAVKYWEQVIKNNASMTR
jgi:hypothetical protein